MIDVTRNSGVAARTSSRSLAASVVASAVTRTCSVWKQRDVDRRRGWLPQVVANIRHDAHDLLERARPAELRIEKPADRRLTTEVALREGLVDDDNWRILGIEIAADESPPGNERNPHRLEVSRSHRRHGRFDRLAGGARHGKGVPPGPAEHVELSRADSRHPREIAKPIEHLQYRRALLIPFHAPYCFQGHEQHV